MSILSEARHAAEFLLSEAPGTRSRNTGQIEQSQTIVPGTLLGKVGETGTQTVAAAVALAGNVGNGTVGSLTADANAMAGDWKVVIIEPAANAGAFEVQRPDGTVEETGTVAVAYNGGINFTLADGATDFSAGDGFIINVSYAAGVNKYEAFDPAGTNGKQTPVAVAMYPVTTGAGETVKTAVIDRDAEININLIVWTGSPSQAQKDAALAALDQLSGIRAR